MHFSGLAILMSGFAPRSGQNLLEGLKRNGRGRTGRGRSTTSDGGNAQVMSPVFRQGLVSEVFDSSKEIYHCPDVSRKCYATCKTSRSNGISEYHKLSN